MDIIRRINNRLGMESINDILAQAKAKILSQELEIQDLISGNTPIDLELMQKNFSNLQSQVADMSKDYEEMKRKTEGTLNDCKALVIQKGLSTNEADNVLSLFEGTLNQVKPNERKKSKTAKKAS